MAPDDEITLRLPAEETVPRCGECLREVLEAGPIAPTSADGALFASPEHCLRGGRRDGAAWSWCHIRRRLSLWAADPEASPR